MDQQIVTELEAQHAKAKRLNQQQNLSEYGKMLAPEFVMQDPDGSIMDREASLAAIAQQFSATKSFHADHHRIALEVLADGLVKETVVQSIELGVPFLFFFTRKHQFQTTDEITWRRAGDAWQMVKCKVLADDSSTGGSDTVIHIPADDEAMKQAGALARKTFRYFWRELSWEQRRIVPGLDISLVKVACSDPPEVRERNPGGLEVEYMWVGDVEFDGRQISGTLLNAPDTLQTYQEGQSVKLPAKHIYDWMYVIMGEVYGGFTVELLRSRMGKRELRQHDKGYGLDFGELGVVQLVPEDFFGERATMGDSSTPLEGLPFRIAGNPALIAKTEHPMSVNMRESLEEALRENPSMATETDDAGFSMLHNLALAGSFDGVDVCLKYRADPNQKAPNGMTPYTLAKIFAWKKVMQRLEQAGAAG